MNIVALETSSPLLSIAVKKGKGPVRQKTVFGFFTHAENIIPLLDRLLSREKLSIRQVDTFLIGRGPGSFTGLRVGFATLKGFLAFQKSKCFGALSLDAIAENAKLPEGAELAVLLDARREKIYARFYRQKKSRWQPAGKAGVFLISEILEKLPNKVYATGDALAKYRDKFESARGKKIHFLAEDFWYPRAASLIHWFETREKKLVPLESPRDFVPFYLRQSEAEEKRKIHAVTC